MVLMDMVPNSLSNKAMAMEAMAMDSRDSEDMAISSFVIVLKLMFVRI